MTIICFFPVKYEIESSAEREKKEVKIVWGEVILEQMLCSVIPKMIAIDFQGSKASSEGGQRGGSGVVFLWALFFSKE